METERIKALIEAAIPGAQAEVTGDGRHFEAMVVSDAFEGKSLSSKAPDGTGYGKGRDCER